MALLADVPSPEEPESSFVPATVEMTPFVACSCIPWLLTVVEAVTLVVAKATTTENRRVTAEKNFILLFVTVNVAYTVLMVFSCV